MIKYLYNFYLMGKVENKNLLPIPKKLNKATLYIIL